MVRLFNFPKIKYAIINTMVETGSSDQSVSHLKTEKYEKCFGELEVAIDRLGASATEVQKQKALCEVLAAAF